MNIETARKLLARGDTLELAVTEIRPDQVKLGHDLVEADLRVGFLPSIYLYEEWTPIGSRLHVGELWKARVHEVKVPPAILPNENGYVPIVVRVRPVTLLAELRHAYFDHGLGKLRRMYHDGKSVIREIEVTGTSMYVDARFSNGDVLKIETVYDPSGISVWADYKGALLLAKEEYFINERQRLGKSVPDDEIWRSYRKLPTLDEGIRELLAYKKDIEEEANEGLRRLLAR